MNPGSPKRDRNSRGSDPLDVIGSNACRGHWGCIDFSNNKGANLTYNEFEYGGCCSSGDRQQVADGAATFKNLSFSHLPDAAIQKAFNCPAASELTQWFGFQYSDVKDTVVCGDLASPCQ
jgi:hypothetical protein